MEKYFPLHHVRFIAVNDQYDSEDSSNSAAHMIVPLKNMVNEAYAADISRKVRSQQRQAMQEGQFVGSRPPYGYLKDPKDCHKLVVNPDTAPVVRQIFQWTVDGVSLCQIVRNLNESRVPTPSQYQANVGIITHERLIGSGPWQTRIVNKLLADQVYAGDMVQGKTKAVGHKQESVPMEDCGKHARELREGHPIVSETCRKEGGSIKQAERQGILPESCEAGAAGEHIQRAPGGDSRYAERGNELSADATGQEGKNAAGDTVERRGIPASGTMRLPETQSHLCPCVWLGAEEVGNMRVVARNRKGGKDRYTVLSQSCLEILRDY